MEELSLTEYLAAQFGYLGIFINPNSTLRCISIPFINKVDETVLTIELEPSSTKLITTTATTHGGLTAHELNKPLH